MFTILKIKDKEYKLRLTTRGCVEIEKRLGTNPLNVFMEANEGRIPKIEDLLIILHGCLQDQHHGISLDKMYDIYDEFCANGGDLLKLIEVLVKAFTDAGFVPQTENGKNQQVRVK